MLVCVNLGPKLNLLLHFHEKVTIDIIACQEFYHLGAWSIKLLRNLSGYFGNNWSIFELWLFDWGLLNPWDGCRIRHLDIHQVLIGIMVANTHLWDCDLSHFTESAVKWRVF